MSITYGLLKQQNAYSKNYPQKWNSFNTPVSIRPVVQRLKDPPRPKKVVINTSTYNPGYQENLNLNLNDIKSTSNFNPTNTLKYFPDKRPTLPFNETKYESVQNKPIPYVQEKLLPDENENAYGNEDVQMEDMQNVYQPNIPNFQDILAQRQKKEMEYARNIDDYDMAFIDLQTVNLKNVRKPSVAQPEIPQNVAMPGSYPNEEPNIIPPPQPNFKKKSNLGGGKSLTKISKKKKELPLKLTTIRNEEPIHQQQVKQSSDFNNSILGQRKKNQKATPGGVKLSAKNSIAKVGKKTFKKKQTKMNEPQEPTLAEPVIGKRRRESVGGNGTKRTKNTIAPTQDIPTTSVIGKRRRESVGGKVSKRTKNTIKATYDPPTTSVIGKRRRESTSGNEPKRQNTTDLPTHDIKPKKSKPRKNYNEPVSSRTRSQAPVSSRTRSKTRGV
jgi:hypothetical protein